MHFIPFIRPFVFCSLSVLCLAKHKEKFGKAQDSFFYFAKVFITKIVDRNLHVNRLQP